MTDLIKPLSHGDVERKDDQTLAAEASTFLSQNRSHLLICELLTKLREMGLPWWTPKHLRLTYSSADRMRWLAQRPDIRQRITTNLTGLAPKAARKKAPDFQASLIDSCIDDGDITVEEFEVAFDPTDMAVYGPAGDFWRLFRRRMPWDDDATSHQDLVGWLIGALLADKSSLDGTPRTPVLKAWEVRTAIDGRVWHSRVPLDVRVAIDDARFELEKTKPNEPFHANNDLAIAAPALIAASIPLKDLTGVFDVAGRAMGFEVEPSTEPSSTSRSSSESRSDSMRPSTPPRERSKSESRRASDMAAASRRPDFGSDKDDKTIVGPTPSESAEEGASQDEGPPGGDGPEISVESVEGAEDEFEQTNPWVVSGNKEGEDAFSAALDALQLEGEGDTTKSSSKSRKRRQK